MFKKRYIVYIIILASIILEIWSFIISFSKPPFTSLGYFLGAILGFIISIIVFIATLIINYILDRNKANKKYKK